MVCHFFFCSFLAYSLLSWYDSFFSYIFQEGCKKLNSNAAFPYVIHPSNQDEKFMLEALKEAWKAYQKNEVPVGAVLVFEDRIIARGHNQVELLNDATAHAEMLCITSGTAVYGDWRLTDTVLYCTMEPCSMCAGAMFLSRVKRLVWGASDLRHGANGSWVDLFAKDHLIHSIQVESGVLGEYSSELMKQFFREKRLEKEEIDE